MLHTGARKENVHESPRTHGLRCIFCVRVQVIFLSMVCPVLFGLRSFMAFKGATPPLHPLHTLPEGIASSQLLAGQVRQHARKVRWRE